MAVVQESHDQVQWYNPAACLASGSCSQVWFRKWAERSNAERLEQEQAPDVSSSQGTGFETASVFCRLLRYGRFDKMSRRLVRLPVATWHPISVPKIFHKDSARVVKLESCLSRCRLPELRHGKHDLSLDFCTRVLICLYTVVDFDGNPKHMFFSFFAIGRRTCIPRMGNMAGMMMGNMC